MAIKPEDVSRIAYLAKLQVSEAHATRLAEDMNQILGFVEQMQSIDTSATEPLGNPLEIKQPLRADVVTETNQREVLQACAPETGDGLFLVPKVIE